MLIWKDIHCSAGAWSVVFWSILSSTGCPSSNNILSVLLVNTLLPPILLHDKWSFKTLNHAVTAGFKCIQGWSASFIESLDIGTDGYIRVQLLWRFHHSSPFTFLLYIHLAITHIKGSTYSSRMARTEIIQASPSVALAQQSIPPSSPSLPSSESVVTLSNA
jgi:hypothetical protein